MPHSPRKLLKPDAWPAGHRAALAVLVDLDLPESPWPVPSPHVAAAGAAHLLEMLADLDVAPTVIADPRVEARAGLPAGIDIDVAARVEAATDVTEGVTDRLGAAPSGLVCLSGAPLAPSSADLWILDGSGSPFPLLADTGGVVIPYNPWWHDVTWLSPAHPAPPSALLETWSVGLASVRARGELMTVMLSASISGQPGFVETIQRFFDETIGAGDVWITNGFGVASHVNPRQPS